MSLNLNLSHRGITSWGEVIQAIQESDLLPKSLEKLYLSGNKISSWEGCGSLPESLRWLFLNNNQISSWEGCDLLPKSLILLELSNNQISSWQGSNHESLCDLLPKSLEVLYIRNNQISSWEGSNHESLCDLLPKSLKVLYLNDNQISSWDHFRLGSLIHLDISGNPLDNNSIRFGHIEAAYPIKLYLIRKRFLHNWSVRFRVRRLALILELNKDCPMLEDFRLYLS